MSAQQRENAMTTDRESEDDGSPVTYIDRQVNLNLPADAPKGHPHIIDMTSPRSPPENLLAVDAIATVLYKWNAMALSDLLDLEKWDFYWSYNEGGDNEFYVGRNGINVRIGSTPIVSSPERPEFLVTYRINQNNCWKITGGAKGPYFNHHLFDLNTKDGREDAVYYDNYFAKYLIVNERWKKSFKEDVLRYDVNGEDMLSKEGVLRYDVSGEDMLLGDSDESTVDESNENGDEDTDADADAEVRLPWWA